MSMKQRRYFLGVGCLVFLPLLLVCLVGGNATTEAQVTASIDAGEAGALKVYYLEIVTPDVNAVCKTLERLHGATFGEPDSNLGNARTARVPGGGLIAVRAPLRKTEQPIVRPYLLVGDIKASVDEAAAAGAKIALPPMRLPGHGTCAIFIQGGVEHGLWQLDRRSE